MGLTQENRWLSISPPAAQDKLFLTAIRGEEKLSHLFHFTLDLVADQDDTSAIKVGSLLGKPVGFSMKLPDDSVRFFHGIICRFYEGRLDAGEERLRHYRADVVPWLWALKQNSDCRVFQEKTIPQIVEQVCEDAGRTDYKISLKGTYAKLDYCVQYGESDFDFISRLLERVGIFYYFMHEEAKHTLVFADAASSYADCDEDEVEFQGAFDGDAWGTVQSWERRYELMTSKYVLCDYDFESPPTSLEVAEKTKVKFGVAKDAAFYEYPGGYTKVPDGKPLALARMEQREAQHNIVFGTSMCPTFFAGGKFKVKEHPVDSEKNQKFALIAVNHQVREPTLFYDDGASYYENSFQCVPVDVPFRPARTTPRPLVRGPQSAKVVGVKGEEIYTDKYGRVKVQFQWDREGKFDDKSSCWLRVAQTWAGSNWGSLFTPRVDMEVLVDFLDGDPDRPIVTGCVYNADNMPPYDPIGKAWQSGIKTLSTDKGKAKNFNELRFEDKIGEELVYFHAEKDFERVVENDDKLKVGFETKDKGDQTIDIYNDRTVTIDKGKDTLTIKTGDRDVSIDKGNDTLTIKQGNLKISIKAGACDIEAAKAITLKVGASSIKLDPTGINIEATKVVVAAKLKAEMKGVLVDVAASGMLTLKGGLVKIN